MRVLKTVALAAILLSGLTLGFSRSVSASDDDFPARLPEPLTEVHIIAFKGGFNLPI